VRRGYAYALIAAACVLPRAAVLAHERAAILSTAVEKSDILARVFIKTGTFGYVPGLPSASTQPVYGWFLVAVYWIAGRHWWSLGSAQIAVALATAFVVYEIGRRFVSPRAGLLAAVIATLQPYLVWHDLHVNREIVDQLLGAAMFLLAMLAGRRRSLPLAAALGLVTGIAILSNSRLLLLPIAFAAYLLWRKAGWAAALVVPALAALTLVPWVVRNKVEVGCFSITTDARALWKANNPHTYDLLAKGIWIDFVPELPNAPITPTRAREIYLATGRKVDVHECAQQSHYQHLVIEFWKDHPGEKGKLMAQATWLLWRPSVTADGGGDSTGGGALHSLRHLAEPAFVIPLYILAIAGFFVVSRPLRALALIFVGYETLAALVFAGTTRYRVPWDFVLALLAAAALEALLLRLAQRRRNASMATAASTASTRSQGTL
jgi:4-amino-4-deoxy-L-arabinose transferase-like glycosyltransferase